MPNRDDTPTQAAKRKAAPGQKPPAAPEEQDGAKFDAIDEEAWETFPASDAPSHWAGRDIAPESKPKSDDES